MKKVSFILLNFLLISASISSIPSLKKARQAWEIIIIGEVVTPDLDFGNIFLRDFLTKDIDSLAKSEKANFGFDSMIEELDARDQWAECAEIYQVKVRSYRESFRRPSEFHYRISGYGNGTEAYRIFTKKIHELSDKIDVAFISQVTTIKDKIESKSFLASYQNYLVGKYSVPPAAMWSGLSSLDDPTVATDNFNNLMVQNQFLAHQDDLLKERLDSNQRRIKELESIIKLRTSLDLSCRKFERTPLTLRDGMEGKLLEVRDCRLFLDANVHISSVRLVLNFTIFWLCIGVGLNLILRLGWNSYLRAD